MSNEFSNKKAVITGGNGGIGSAIINNLLQKGCEVISLVRQNENPINNPLISYIQCDISSEIEVKKAFSLIKHKVTTVDYLINAAGISSSKKIEENTSEGFENDIKTNLVGVFLCCLHSYSLIKSGGSIVNIASIRGQAGTPSSIGYAASKAGVINLTKSLAIQLANKKIRVNCICPSAVYPTGMSKHWSKEKIKRISEEIPFKRLARPEDISNAVYFFLSDLSSYITGQTLSVNGGELML